jgi:SAM-dependent methyltransferase
MKPPKLEPTKPGIVGKVRWKMVKTFMQTVGKSSNGVSLGYKYGFNSGTMLDYIYLNKPQGRWKIGKILDKTYLNAVGWRAIRNRRELLQSLLRVELKNFRAEGEAIRLLDPAAGPGRYLQELLKEDPANIQVLCRDLKEEGLNQGRLEAAASGLDNIHFEVGDAFNPAPTADLLGAAPNILVVSGLYEQISDDATVIKSLQTFYNFLAPGGTILLTTQLQHPQLDFVVNVMTSYSGGRFLLKCRPLEKIEGWVQEAGFCKINSSVEKEGLCAVTVAHK